MNISNSKTLLVQITIHNYICKTQYIRDTEMWDKKRK